MFNEEYERLLNWVNDVFDGTRVFISDLFNDFRSGVNLIYLIEIVTNSRFPIPFSQKPRNIFAKRENCASVITYLQERMKFLSISLEPDLLMKGDPKTTIIVISTIKEKLGKYYNPKNMSAKMSTLVGIGHLKAGQRLEISYQGGVNRVAEEDMKLDDIRKLLRSKVPFMIVNTMTYEFWNHFDTQTEYESMSLWDSFKDSPDEPEEAVEMIIPQEMHVEEVLNQTDLSIQVIIDEQMAEEIGTEITNYEVPIETEEITIIQKIEEPEEILESRITDEMVSTKEPEKSTLLQPLIRDQVPEIGADMLPSFIEQAIEVKEQIIKQTIKNEIANDNQITPLEEISIKSKYWDVDKVDNQVKTKGLFASEITGIENNDYARINPDPSCWPVIAPKDQILQKQKVNYSYNQDQLNLDIPKGIPIILDIGSHSIRIGTFPHSFPLVITSSALYKTKEYDVFGNFSHQRIYYGESATHYSNHYPQSVSDYILVLEQLFGDITDRRFTKNPIVILANSFDKIDLSKIIDYLYSQIMIKHISVLLTCEMISYSLGIGTCIVIDIGHSKTLIDLVYEGKRVPRYCSFITFGGLDITLLVQKYLKIQSFIDAEAIKESQELSKDIQDMIIEECVPSLDRIAQIYQHLTHSLPPEILIQMQGQIIITGGGSGKGISNRLMEIINSITQNAEITNDSSSSYRSYQGAVNYTVNPRFPHVLVSKRDFFDYGINLL